MRTDLASDLRILAGLVASVGLIFVVFYASGLRINTTPSHPIGIYRIVDQESAVGLYAMFCAPATLEELPELDPNAPPICTEDHRGRKLLKRIVAIDHAAGTVTVRGDHPASIDSRHFGSVQISEIKAVLVLFWVKPFL